MQIYVFNTKNHPTLLSVCNGVKKIPFSGTIFFYCYREKIGGGLMKIRGRDNLGLLYTLPH